MTRGRPSRDVPGAHLRQLTVPSAVSSCWRLTRWSSGVANSASENQRRARESGRCAKSVRNGARPARSRGEREIGRRSRSSHGEPLFAHQRPSRVGGSLGARTVGHAVEEGEAARPRTDGTCPWTRCCPAVVRGPEQPGVPDLLRCRVPTTGPVASRSPGGESRPGSRGRQGSRAAMGAQRAGRPPVWRRPSDSGRAFHPLPATAPDASPAPARRWRCAAAGSQDRAGRVRAHDRSRRRSLR